MNKFLLLSLSILIFSSNSFSQVNLSAGLIAYFPFNGNTMDASGNGNNAANFGATLSTDQWGNLNNAYSFNGVNNYMQIANNASLQPTNLTLCARVKPLGFYNGLCYNNCIIDKGNPDYVPGNFGLRFTNTITGSCFSPGFATQNYRSDIGDVSSSSFTIPFGGAPYVVTNQWDCIISTYDGTTVNVYVNGVLRYNYVQTTIGSNNMDVFLGRKNNASYPYWFNGVMDEVRIYNRALNIQEIDSVCNLITTPETIINNYAAVSSYNPCTNSLDVDTSSGFNSGDTVLLIQMKGAEMDSSNSAAFGDIINYQGCGNYEINVIQSITGNTINLLNTLDRTYEFVNGKVQLVSVPSYHNYNLNSLHTCMPWDGTKGGVFIIKVIDTLSLISDIDVSGRGFKGGVSNIVNSGVYGCNNFQYFDPPNIDQSAAKGEGIHEISSYKSFARGKLVNGGGGGNGHNGGGGGGSNAGSGGLGGYQHDGCLPNPIPNTTGGIGGMILDYNNSSNKIFLGGGGGAGQSNNYNSSYPAGNLYSSNGAPGGGIAIVIASHINTSGGKIISNGKNGYICTNPGAAAICHDGMGGGGAGGVILLKNNSMLGLLNIECKGGNGGNMSASAGQGLLGPGGGGGGGIFWKSGSSIPSTINVNNSFGINGVCSNYSNNPWGAESGQSGTVLTGLQIPIDTFLFVNPVTAFAGNDDVICFGSSAQLQASGGIIYSWLPSSSLNNPSISNPIASPNSTTTYTVTATNSDGCSATDIVTISITPTPSVTALASPSSLCSGDSTILTGSGASSYSWSGGVNNGVAFFPAATNTYTVTGTNAAGCSATSTITVNVNPVPVINAIATPQQVCVGKTTTLTGSGATSYAWSGGVNNGIPFTPVTAATYTVTGTDANGCSNTSTVSISLLSNPVVSATATPPDLCAGQTSVLNASGASSYSWTSGVSNGVPFTPASTATYTVTGTATNGCTATSTVSLTVHPLPVVLANANPSSVCTGMPTTLSGSGATSYLWTGGISNGVPFVPSSNATYTVTGTDANGCSNTSSVTITLISNLPIGVLPSEPLICIGDSIQLTASGATSYQWQPNSSINATNISNPLVYPSSTTTYTVTGSDASGCSGSATINIEVIPRPNLIVTKSGDVECNIHTIQLMASGTTSYSWTPSTFLSSPNSGITNAVVNAPTTFTVTGTIGACVVTDSIHVDLYNDDESMIYIPNAFSPNDDGNNDCLKVLNSAKFISFYFTIYNRWGQMVFESDDPTKCWNGYFKNQPANSSVYYYYLKAETRCGKIFKKGDITLIR